jgi:hypothetical protein
LSRQRFDSADIHKELIAADIPDRNLYSDTASGKRDDRPGLDACLKALREGDTLVVWKLDRLGRNLRHLVNVVHDLTERAVGLRVLPARARQSTPQPPASWCSGSSLRWPSSSASSSLSAPAPVWQQPEPGDAREGASENDPSQDTPRRRSNGHARHGCGRSV